MRLMSFCATAMHGGEDGGDGADPGDDRQRGGRSERRHAGMGAHQRIHARDQEHAGRHHGGRVDQAR